MTHAWTQRAAVARSRRRLNKVKAFLEQIGGELGYEWGDENQYVCNLADLLRDVADEVLDLLREALDQVESTSDKVAS